MAEQRTLDARFARIADRMPGFAGIHFRDGALIVRTTSAAAVDVAQLRDELDREFGAHPALADAAIVTESADFDYVQLYGWFRAIAALAQRTPVTGLDIAEDRNRIVVGVTGVDVDEFAAEIAGDLDAWGVPDEAVVIEDQPRAVLREELTDRFRPVFGGIHIHPQIHPPCSLGFVVKTPSGGDGIIINSHCTNQEGSLDRGPTFQTDVVPEDRIGIEARDPQPFSCIQNPNNGCRYTDAALIILDQEITFNLTKIARTQSSGYLSGSTELNPSNRVFTLEQRANAFVGLTLHKVGRTTGWTTGTVTRTCVDFPVEEGYTRLCQAEVDAGNAGGDSGSPVFGNMNLSASTANLYGILWGGFDPTPYVYSESWALELELGCFEAVVNEEPCLEEP